MKKVERNGRGERLSDRMIALMAEPKDESYATRSSLLRRVKNTQDQESWREFYDLYSKLVLGFARKGGLNESEAQEVVQETMIAAAKHLPEHRYDPKVCSFKTWLLNFSTWRMQDQVRKRRAPSYPVGHQGQGVQADDASRTDTIERVPDPHGEPLEDIWAREWEAALLEAALARVKAQVEAKQWQIFDLYVLKEWSVKEVTSALPVSTGQVYLVKHRISALLKKELKRLQRRAARLDGTQG